MFSRDDEIILGQSRMAITLLYLFSPGSEMRSQQYKSIRTIVSPILPVQYCTVAQVHVELARLSGFVQVRETQARRID